MKKVIVTQVVLVHDEKAIIDYAKSKAEQFGMCEEDMDDLGTAVRECIILHHPDPCPLDVGIELTRHSAVVEGGKSP